MEGINVSESESDQFIAEEHEDRAVEEFARAFVVASDPRLNSEHERMKSAKRMARILFERIDATKGRMPDASSKLQRYEQVSSDARLQDFVIRAAYMELFADPRLKASRLTSCIETLKTELRKACDDEDFSFRFESIVQKTKITQASFKNDKVTKPLLKDISKEMKNFVQGLTKQDKDLLQASKAFQELPKAARMSLLKVFRESFAKHGPHVRDPVAEALFQRQDLTEGQSAWLFAVQAGDKRGKSKWETMLDEIMREDHHAADAQVAPAPPTPPRSAPIQHLPPPPQTPQRTTAIVPRPQTEFEKVQESANKRRRKGTVRR